MLPFGSWPTPVTSELVVRAARTPTAVAFDGDAVWWSESRPDERGRIAVRRRGADGALWFADWSSQRLHRRQPGGEPVALTPAPAEPRGRRYADGEVSPDGSTILCVQETHAAGREAVNTIVRLPAHEPSGPVVVVDGPDFVAAPR